MGEIAEMMLDGTLCEGCGGYLGRGDLGFPQYCPGCKPATKIPYTMRKSVRIRCKLCKKTIKASGLNDHMRDKHGEKK